MKSVMICIVIALSLCALVSADGYGGSYSGSYTPSLSNVQASVSAALQVVSDLCLNLIANLGIEGCIGVLEGFVSLSSTSSLLCRSQITTYVQAAAGIFAQAGLGTYVGGVFTIDAAVQAALQAGGTVTADIQAKLDAAVHLCASLSGGVVGSAGLILGVASQIDINVLLQLVAGVNLVAQVNGILGCVKTSCDAGPYATY